MLWRNYLFIILVTILGYSLPAFSQLHCQNIFTSSTAPLSDSSILEGLLKRFSAFKKFQAEAKPLKTGIEGFAAKIALIERAKQTIDISYYIFKKDEAGLAILNTLKQAMDRGVKVRVLIDGAGSFGKENRHANEKVSLTQSLFEGMLSANKLITLVSPYIFFSAPEVHEIKEWLLKNPNASFKIYTNSLNSTDHFLVYALFRYLTLPQLLELQADPRIGSRLQIYFYKAKRLMHMKAVLIDNNTSFITTSNFDPRSRLHNSEIGFWMDSPKNYSSVSEKIQEIQNLSQPIQSFTDADHLLSGPSAPFKKFSMQMICHMLNVTELEQLF